MGRAELERAFTALGERLARRGVVANMLVVGGAAMALAYNATRVTRDVDARFMPHGIVIEEARRVADDLGLPYWWLNEQASVLHLRKRRPGQTPCVRPSRVAPDGRITAVGIGGVRPVSSGIQDRCIKGPTPADTAIVGSYRLMPE